MMSHLTHFQWIFFMLAAEKKTLKTGQLLCHYGSSYFATTLSNEPNWPTTVFLNLQLRLGTCTKTFHQFLLLNFN